MFTREAEPPVVLPAGGPPRFTRRTVLLAVLVLAGLSVFWAIRHSSADTAAPPPAEVVAAPTADATAVAAAPPAPPPVPAGGTCGDFGSRPETKVDNVVPTWSVSGYVPAPAAPTVGPLSTLPVRWCYAHTLPGALFAATNFVAQMAVADPAALATYTMAATPARDQVLRAAAMNPTVPPVLAVDTAWQWLGYHTIAYTSRAATLDVLHRWQGQAVAVTYTLLWEGGDWKVIYPDALQFTQRILPAIDPTYWLLWGHE
jgi:hypothetical protein